MIDSIKTLGIFIPSVLLVIISGCTDTQESAIQDYEPGGNKTPGEVSGTDLKLEGKIKISNFGTFSIRKKHARLGRNPQTGEPMEIRARQVLTFKPSKNLKRLINNI